MTEFSQNLHPLVERYVHQAKVSSTFLNEYRLVLSFPTIHGRAIHFPKVDTEISTLDYRVAGQLAAGLSNPSTGIVYAPLSGNSIVSDRPFSLDSGSVTVQADGRISELKVGLDNPFELTPEHPGYFQALRMLVNRKIDFALREQIRDGRFYYGPKAERHRQFLFRLGAYVASKEGEHGVNIVIDPVTQISSTLNLDEMLREELKRLDVSDWHKLTQQQTSSLNRKFLSRAYNLRTDYTEITSFGEEESKRYRFVRFDFSKSISDPLEPGGKESPVEWHTRMGRRESIGATDQPVAIVQTRAGHQPAQIPSLLRVAPNMSSLRILGLSEVAQNIGQKGASERVAATMEYAKKLHAAGLIGSVEEPVKVETGTAAPIEWTLDKDYLEINKTSDFQRYFSKGKMLRKPTIGRFIALYDKPAKADLVVVCRGLGKIASRFGVELPNPILTELPESLSERLDTVVRKADQYDLGLDDLALFVVSGHRDDGNELSFHDQVKRYSLTERVFPTQFINVESIERYRKGTDNVWDEQRLTSEIMNPAFKQIVAKCGGVPHGLASGFATRGTIFVGVDRYKNHFDLKASVSAAVSVFDEHGGHIASNASLFDRDESDFLHGLEYLLDVSLRKVAKQMQVRKIVLLRDGTPQRDGEREREALRRVAGKYGAVHIFIEAPKGTHTRLYDGEADETGVFAEKPKPFTIVVNLPGRPNDFIVLATDPWRGTPKPMLYRISDMSSSLNLAEEKAGLAKTIAWLCTHSWVSPTSTRLPVPLDYADKMAELVGRIGTAIKIEIDRPLYL